MRVVCRSRCRPQGFATKALAYSFYTLVLRGWDTCLFAAGRLGAKASGPEPHLESYYVDLFVGALPGSTCLFAGTEPHIRRSCIAQHTGRPRVSEMRFSKIVSCGSPVMKGKGSRCYLFSPTDPTHISTQIVSIDLIDGKENVQ